MTSSSQSGATTSQPGHQTLPHLIPLHLPQRPSCSLHPRPAGLPVPGLSCSPVGSPWASVPLLFRIDSLIPRALACPTAFGIPPWLRYPVLWFHSPAYFSLMLELTFYISLCYCFTKLVPFIGPQTLQGRARVCLCSVCMWNRTEGAGEVTSQGS